MLWLGILLVNLLYICFIPTWMDAEDTCENLASVSRFSWFWHVLVAMFHMLSVFWFVAVYGAVMSIVMLIIEFIKYAF